MEVKAQIPKERTLFVTGLDQNATERLLMNKFSQYGQIERVITKQTGSFKQSFLVIFSKESDLQHTLNNFNQKIFNEPTVRIQQYIDMTELEKQANILIEDLPQDYDEKKLKCIFERFGKIISVRVIFKNYQTSGIGFIQFQNKESAEKCVTEASKLNLKIKICKEKDRNEGVSERTQLFISKINNQSDSLKEELIRHFSEFGDIEFVNIVRKQDVNVYLKFFKHESAQNALNSEKLFNGQKLTISWAISSDQDIEANLFARNLKSTVTEQELTEKIKQIAPVSKVTLLSYENPNKQNVEGMKDLNQQKVSAYIYFNSAEDGKKLMEKAYIEPIISSLFINDNVYISPILNKKNRDEFAQMKSYNKDYQRIIYNQMLYPPQNLGFQQYQQYSTQYGPRQYYQNQNRQRFHNNFGQQQQYQQNRNNYQGNNRQGQGQTSQNDRFNGYTRNSNQIEVLPTLEVLEQLKSQNKLEELRNIIGKPLFHKIQQLVGPQKAPQITGILLDFDVFTMSELLRLVNDSTYLKENVQDAVESLNAQEEQ